MRVKALVLVAVTLILVASAWASSETLLYSFCSQSSCTDGYIPYGPLVADSSGNHLYGTTYQGGANNFGEVFEMTNSGGTWTEAVIYSFAGAANSDGAYPFGGMVLDAAGNLYGTTYNGGANSQGTVFQLSKSGGTWKETVLHTFDNITGNDGTYPYGALAIDASGNLYGTTQQGGKFGGGTIFTLKLSNGKYKYQLIHSFLVSGSTAYSPWAGLVIDPKTGYLYGTTYYGGVVWNAGAVYQLRSVSGVWILKVIYNFLGDSLGQYTEAGLAVDANGNLYGTNYQGGGFNLGAVFRLTPTGKTFTQKIIYSFKGYTQKDGAYPYFAGVTMDAQGNIYGTTYQGGSSAANNLNYGTVYKLTAGSFKESVLWSFLTTTGDGYNPYHQAIVVNGKLYGTTNAGGAHGGGTVYEVTP